MFPVVDGLCMTPGVFCLPNNETDLCEDQITYMQSEFIFITVEFVSFGEGWDLPSGSAVKNPPANSRDMGSIPGSGRSFGGGSGTPFQYSCLENLTDRGTWWAIVHGVTKELDMTQQLNNNIFKFYWSVIFNAFKKQSFFGVVF